MARYSVPYHEDRYPNVKHPLYDPAYLAGLQPRQGAYWMMLATGRAIGLAKLKGSYWHAKISLGKGKFKMSALGAADASGWIGKKQILTFEEARDAALAWFKTYEDDAIEAVPLYDRTPEIPVPSHSDCYTVGHAIADHLTWLRNSGKDIRPRLRLAKRTLLPEFGKIPLAELTAEQIKGWLQREIHRPTAKGRAAKDVPDHADALRARKRTMNGELAILRGALNHAFLNRQIESDAEWRRVPVFKNTSRAHAFQIADRAIVAALSCARPDEANLIKMALVTGCRLTELVGMRVGDYVPETKKLRVVETKIGVPFIHRLSDEADGVIRPIALDRAPDERLLIRSDGRNWTVLSARYALRRIKKENGDAVISFSGLRHTYASHLAESGVPSRIIADQLGHLSSTTTEMYYAHLSEDARDKILRKFVPEMLPA